MIAVQVSVAEGRLWVRPMIQVTAEVLHHPPSNQPRGGQSRSLPATPVSRQPQRSEPSHAADLQRWSRVLKRCVPHPRSEYAHTRPRCRSPGAEDRMLAAPGTPNRTTPSQTAQCLTGSGNRSVHFRRQGHAAAASVSADLPAPAERARGRAGSGT